MKLFRTLMVLINTAFAWATMFNQWLDGGSDWWVVASCFVFVGGFIAAMGDDWNE